MQVTTLRQNFMTLQTFWTERKNDEAVKMVKEGLEQTRRAGQDAAAPAPDQPPRRQPPRNSAATRAARATRCSGRVTPRPDSGSGRGESVLVLAARRLKPARYASLISRFAFLKTLSIIRAVSLPVLVF